MKKAICIRCGFNKGKPLKRCPNCGFDPSKVELDMAKSIFLSDSYQISNGDRIHSDGDLDQISREIKEGKEINFDQSALKDLLKQKEALGSVTAVGHIKLFLFGLMFIVIPITALLLVLYRYVF